MSDFENRTLTSIEVLIAFIQYVNMLISINQLTQVAPNEQAGRAHPATQGVLREYVKVY